MILVVSSSNPYLQIQALHSKLGYIICRDIMIKAPFRFDVEYFSIVVVFRQVIEEERHYFRSQKEKDLFITNAKNEESMSPKQLKVLQTMNYHTKTVPKQLLYFIVQNKRTSQFLASVNRTQDLQIELRAIFSDVSSIYSYIRSKYDTDLIKMTSKGNLVIDYFISQTIYQLKIQNFPFSLPSIGFEEIWKQLKFNWDNRRQTNSDSSQKYLKLISKSGLAGQKIKKGHESPESRQYQRQTNEPYVPYVQQLPRFPYRPANKELDYIRTPQSKPTKHHRLASKYSHRRKRPNLVHSSSQSAEMPQQQRFMKTKRFETYKDYDQSAKLERQTPKQIMKSPFQQRKRMKYKEDLHAFSGKESQQQDKKVFGLKTKPSFQQSLKRIQSKIQELKKQNVKQEIIDGITQYFSYKFDKFMETIMHQFSKQKSSTNTTTDNFPKDTAHPLKFSNQTTLNAFKLFYSQKQHMFIQEMRLPHAVVKQNIERLWVQIGADGQMSYKERVLAEKLSKQRSKKSTKKEPLKNCADQKKDINREQKFKFTGGFKNEEKDEHQSEIIVEQQGPVDESGLQKRQ